MAGAGNEVAAAALFGFDEVFIVVVASGIRNLTSTLLLSEFWLLLLVNLTFTLTFECICICVCVFMYVFVNVYMRLPMSSNVVPLNTSLSLALKISFVNLCKFCFLADYFRFFYSE